MSTDRDTTRIVRSWLDEGVTTLPDRVLSAVLDQVPATPQRRAGWLARRFPPMNTTTRIALAAIAVVILAFAGIRFLVPPTNTGSHATPSPTASPRPLPFVTGQLQPGSYSVYRSSWTPVPFKFTLPAGWTIGDVDGVSKHAGKPDEVAFGAFVVTHVYANACHWQGTLVEVGPTVDELANALATQKERDTSGPTDVTVGGYTAKRIELTAPADISMCKDAFIRMWPDAGGDETGGWGAQAGQTDEVYVVDVGGERVVIDAWHFPATSAADLAELEGIIASIRFQP